VTDPVAVTAEGGRRQAAMPFIMLTVLIDMLSVGLIIPVLPTLVGRFTASPAEQVAWYGVIAFTYGFSQFVASPVLGALSDRYGRRPVLLLGFCGLAINFFVTAMASALWMLLASRLVGGAMQANAAVANAYVADISSPEERTKRFGMLGAMFGIGFMLGPVLGGVLGAIDLQLPFYVAGVLALANLAYGYWVLPESLPAERRRPVKLKALNPVASLYGLARLKGVGLLVAVIACAGLAQFILYTVWVLHGSLKFGWGPKESGWSLFVIGVMSVLVQGFLLGKLLKVFSPQRLALFGLLSSTIAFVAWGAASQGWVVFAVIVANVFGFTTQSAIQSIVSGAADPSQQGEAMGAVSSLNSLMAVVAPMIATPLLGAVSHFPQGDWHIGAPLYFCAALQAVSLLLAWLHFRSTRRPVTPLPGAHASP
jgi:MFS transporter, DHA1 family, tetracycline resistance protein